MTLLQDSTTSELSLCWEEIVDDVSTKVCNSHVGMGQNCFQHFLSPVSQALCQIFQHFVEDMPQ